MKVRANLRSAVASLFALVAWPVFAADGVKIGVLTDMSGFVVDISGPGSLLAARMAVEDFGGSALGKPVEVISGDHQNKPDIGAAIVRRWLDSESVDAVAD